MGIKNYEEITLDSNVFEQARQNFDMLLQRLFKKMEQNNSDEGSITLKVDINMIDDFIPDEDGKAHPISKPVLKHKITTTVPVKDSFDGKKDTGMELVYDDELKRYVLKYVSAGGQRSIFDEDFPDIVNGEATVVEEGVKQIGELPMLECSDIEVAYEAENGGSEDESASGEETQAGEETNGAGGCDGACEGAEDDYDYEE